MATVPTIIVEPRRGAYDVVIDRTVEHSSRFALKLRLSKEYAELVAAELRGALADAFHAGAEEAYARAARGERA